MVLTENTDNDCDNDGDVPEQDENVETFNAETTLEEEGKGSEIQIYAGESQEEEEEVDLYTMKKKNEKKEVKEVVKI
jgi:hypothetical protein